MAAGWDIFAALRTVRNGPFSSAVFSEFPTYVLLFAPLRLRKSAVQEPRVPRMIAAGISKIIGTVEFEALMKKVPKSAGGGLGSTDETGCTGEEMGDSHIVIHEDESLSIDSDEEPLMTFRYAFCPGPKMICSTRSPRTFEKLNVWNPVG